MSTDKTAQSDPAELAETTQAASTQTAQSYSGESVEAKAKAPGQFWLVIHGIFAGAYLLYIIGWAIYIFGNPVTHYTNPSSIPGTDLLAAIMYEFGEALAIAAPLIWLLTVIAVIPSIKPMQRTIWLIIGAAVMIPWPFILNSLFPMGANL